MATRGQMQKKTKWLKENKKVNYPKNEKYLMPPPSPNQTKSQS